jgi:hypothetical protein
LAYEAPSLQCLSHTTHSPRRNPAATDNRQPTTGNRQPTTDNRQPTTGNRQPATDNYPLAPKYVDSANSTDWSVRMVA